MEPFSKNTTFYAYSEYKLIIGDAEFTIISDRGISCQNQKVTTFLHSHGYNEIFYVLSGSIKIYTEESVQTLETGDAAIIPAGLFHSTEHLETAYRVNIAFSVRKREEEGEPYYEQFRTILKGKKISIFREFIGKNAFERLLHYYYSDIPDRHELVCACMHEIIALIKSAYYQKENDTQARISLESSNYRNYIIDQYFAVNYDEEASLTELAELLHLSVKQTQRIIKVLYGESFREHLLRLKMAQAKTLLENTEHSASEVAALLGYSSVNSFLAGFKKYTGVTPKDYRKMHCGHTKDNKCTQFPD